MAAKTTTPGMPKIPTSGSSADLLKYYQDLETYQTVQNKTRETEIRGLYGEIINRYSSGGSFEAEALGQLGKQKTQDVGKYTQDMIGSGMYGTTQTAQLGSRWEQEIGAPSRLKLEDIMAQRLSGAQGDMASFIERIQNAYPDTGQIASLFQGASSGGGYSGGGGGSSGGSGESPFLWNGQQVSSIYDQEHSEGSGSTYSGGTSPSSGPTAANAPGGPSSSTATSQTGGGGTSGGMTMGYLDRLGIWHAGPLPSNAPMYQFDPRPTSTINAGPRVSKPLDLSSMDAGQYYTPVKKDPLAAPTVKKPSSSSGGMSSTGTTYRYLP
jgi:hypothetical protein